MPKRRLILGVLAVGLLAALIITFLIPCEPTYAGKPLSHWVLIFRTEESSSEEYAAAANAVRHIGAQGVPFLLRWIRYTKPDSPTIWQPVVDLVNDTLGIYWIPGEESGKRASGAIDAMAVLGPQARSAIPELTRLMNDRTRADYAWRATYTLAYLGDGALPPLLAAFTNHQAPAHAEAAMNIRFLGTNALAGAPVFLQHLNDEDQEVAETAAIVLSRLGFKPQVVIPMLTANLQHSRSDLRRSAVRALGGYGRQADSALPALTKILDDADPVMRRAATNALRKIAPEVLTNAPPK